MFQRLRGRAAASGGRRQQTRRPALAGRGGQEDCSCSGGCIAVTRGCVRAGAGTSTQPRHPVVDLRTSVGPRPGTPPVLPLSGSPPAGCRAARPSPARHCPAICENVPVWLFLVMSIVCTSCSGLHFAPWITYTVDGNPKEKLFIFSRVCKFFADIFARPAHHVPAGWSRHTEQVWPKLNR